jgi:hypothetical protein
MFLPNPAFVADGASHDDDHAGAGDVGGSIGAAAAWA